MHGIVRIVRLTSLIGSLGLGNWQAQAADLRAQVQQYRLAHESAIVSQLDALTRLKSIAADPAGLIATAHTLEEALKQRGFEVSELTTGSASPPAVFGALRVKNATRTVVFYAHYDGQPVTPSQWSSDPFEPVMREHALTDAARDVDWKKATPPFDPEWRLFGRAVSDDKASITAFIAAFDALKAAHTPPSVNLKVLWEGEEEAGSTHLAQALLDNQKLLAADLFLIGDGPVHQSRRPMVYFGARGAMGMEATIYGPVRALHDGHYGNWVPNPAAMAATLIAQMRDDNGRITIPGFHDSVRAITAEEQASLKALPFVDDALKREYGLGRSEGSEDLPASLMRPALNIRGIRAGQVGEAAANAIATNAAISLDFRLVPNQTPADVRKTVEHFITAHGYTIVNDEPDLATRLAHPRIIRLLWEAGYPALRSDMSTAAAKAVIAAATRAAGAPVVVLPMSGGSVPLYMFANVPILRLMRVSVDRERGVVRTGLLGFIGNGLAQYRAGKGCTVLPDGKLDAAAATLSAVREETVPAGASSAANSSAPWPDGTGVQTNPIVDRILANDALAGPGMRALIVVEHGRIVGERYAPGFNASTPLLGWSMTKTVMAGVIGLLVKDGKLMLDQAGLWPGATDGRERIRVADLLAMSSGLEWNEGYGAVSDVTSMLYLQPDMASFARSQPPAHPPGEFWLYSSGTAVILSRIAQESAGGDLNDYIRTRLFNPLGITSATIEPDAHGTPVGSSYMYASARDWARYGQFLLQDGTWGGQDLLPAGYVAMMASPVAASHGQYGMGQTWLWGSEPVTTGVNPDAAFGIPADTFWMSGHDGQSVAIIKSRQLVIVRLGLTPYVTGYSPQRLVQAMIQSQAINR